MNSEEKRRKIESNKIVLAPLATVTHRQILEQVQEATEGPTTIELPSGSGTSIFTVEKFRPK